MLQKNWSELIKPTKISFKAKENMEVKINSLEEKNQSLEKINLLSSIYYMVCWAWYGSLKRI